MKKATTMLEVYHHFETPKLYSKKDFEQFYVNICQDEFNKLIKFINEDDNKIFYIFEKHTYGISTLLNYFSLNYNHNLLFLDNMDINMIDDELASSNQLIPNIMYEMIVCIEPNKKLIKNLFLKKSMIEQIAITNNVINNQSKYNAIFINGIYDFLNIKNNIHLLHDLKVFNKLNIKCIINLPIEAKGYMDYSNNFIEFTLTKQNLKEIVLKRLDKSLITTRALDFAIEYCEEDVKKLFGIILNASEKALENDLETIETEDIKSVLIPNEQKIEDKKIISKSKNKYINNIKIKNYFSIDKMELANLQDKKEVYFVGENGDGKTIVLQALALAYKDENDFPLLAKEYIKDIENKYSLFILEEYKFINHNLFAYGINRNKIDADNKDKSGYAGLFDSPSLQHTTFLNRPQDLFILNTPLINSFKEKLENLLEKKIKIENKNNKIKFYESNKEIEFKMLSEGYKSTIIWLCDLLYRLVENQPNIEKLEDFEAVVLVDEIDLYLHPKWKYKFVYNLRKIFPKIQFIMTTHSMTTILGASKDAVFYKVYKDENGFTKLSQQIDDISDYSANILVTSPIFGMDSAKSRSYNDKENNLSDDDYKQHQLNKKIDEMLENDNDESIKEDILKQLEEYNART